MVFWSEAGGPTIEQEVREAVEDLIEQTGVYRELAETTVPMMVSLFSALPPERHGPILARVGEIFRVQAAEEQSEEEPVELERSRLEARQQLDQLIATARRIVMVCAALEMSLHKLQGRALH